MATPEDMDKTEGALAHRLAEAVCAAEDAGADPRELTDELVEELSLERWGAVITADPSVTAAELMTTAAVLDTSPTWLLTGRELEPTIAAEQAADEAGIAETEQTASAGRQPWWEPRDPQEDE